MDIDFNSLLDAISRFGLKLIGVALLLLGAWIVARWVRRAVTKSLEKTRLDVTLTKFFANISGWLILIMAVLAVLGIFGINTTSFAAVLGATGLAIGLAFQGTLSNFAAGVMLLIFRPFKAGDMVKVAGELGVIDEIDLLTIKIDTLDNRRILIPNSKVFGDTIETLTYHPFRRVDVPVGVDYAADLDRVRAVLEEAAASVEGSRDDPSPQIFLDSLGEAGIGIPFPQMDVHLDR